MKKTWIAAALLSCALLGSGGPPVRAADEALQIQLLKQTFRLPQPEWPKFLGENRHLLDGSFFERCDARIRWGIENNQIEDAIRFSLVADTAAQVNGQKGRYRMSMVYAFLKSGNESLADDMLMNLMLTDPNDSEVRFLRASIMKARGDVVNAYGEFKKASDLGYKRDECLFQMALIDLVIERQEQGEKELNECLALNPNHEGARKELDHLIATRPKFVPGGGGFSAIPTAQKGAPTVTTEVAARAKTIFNEAEAYYHVGDVAKAKSAYLRALETNPGLIKAYVYLGALLYRQGELDDAIRMLSQALQYDNKDKEAWRFLGYCYERRFDVKKAPADLEQAISAFQKGVQVAPDDRQFKSELERVKEKKTPAARRS